MSKLWKRSCTKSNQITRKISSYLHSSSRRVETGFPTPLGNLFLKNRSSPNNSSLFSSLSSKKIFFKKHNHLSSSLSSSSGSESTSPLYSQSPSPSPLLPPRHSCANSSPSASIIEQQQPPPPKCSGKFGGEFATLNASSSIFGNAIDSAIERKGNRDLEDEVNSDASIAAYDHEEKCYYNDDNINYTAVIVSVLKAVVVTIVLILSLYTKKFVIGITFASFSLVFLGRVVYLLKPKQKLEFLFFCRWFWFRPISRAEVSMTQRMRESLEGEEENDVGIQLMRQSQESGDRSICKLRSPWNLIEPRKGSSKLEINGTQIVQPNCICFGKVEENGINSSKSYIDPLKNLLEVGKLQGDDEKDRMAGVRDGKGKIKKNNFWKNFMPKQLRHRKKIRMEGCQSSSFNVVVFNSSGGGNRAQNNEEENGAKNLRKDKVDDEYANNHEFMKSSLMEEDEEKEEDEEGEERNKGFNQVVNDKGLWKHVYSFEAMLSTGQRYGVEPIEIIRCRRRNSLKIYYCLITVIVSVLVGLMAGRIFALALTVICCFSFKWSKSSIILS